MSGTLLVAWLLGFGAQMSGTISARSTPADLNVTIAVPVIRTDGTASGVAVSVPPEPATYYAYTANSVCGPMTLASSEPKNAAFGWRLAVQTVSRSPSEVVLKAEWHRLWERGRPLSNGPKGSTQLVLQRDDRVPLDRLDAPAAAGCNALAIGLEVWVDRPSIQMSAPAEPAASGPLELDVWLVHRAPNNPGEDVQQQTIALAGNGALFFQPARIATPQGAVKVEVSVDIRPLLKPDGAIDLMFLLARSLSLDSPDGWRTSGGSVMRLQLPTPNEVISFDLPSAAGRFSGGGSRVGAGIIGPSAGGRGGAGRGTAGGGARGGGGASVGPGSGAPADPLAGHTYSIRLRVTPAK